MCTELQKSVLICFICSTTYQYFHHTTRESTRDILSSSAANQGDNTVSIAQGGTATPGATKQLLPGQLKAEITLDVRSSSFLDISIYLWVI